MVTTLVLVESCLLAFVNICAFLGNVSLFVVLLRKPALRTQNNMFLLNLAAADLLVSVVNMPMANATLAHGSWMFGEFVCTLTAFVNLLSLVASVMSLAMVSVNRYHFVVKWRTYQQHFSKRKCAVYILSVWVFSGVLCFPPLLGWAEYRYISEQSQCFVHWSSSGSYTLFMVALCLIGPACIMVFCYSKIWKVSDASNKNVSSWGKRTILKSQKQHSMEAPSKGSDVLNTFKANNGGKVHPFPEAESEENVRAAGYASEANSQKERKNPRASKRDVCSDAESKGATGQAPSVYLNIADETTSKAEEKNAGKQQLRGPARRSKRRSQNEAKLTRTLIIIIAVFCLCWTPYAVTIILGVFLPSPLPHVATFSVLLLGYANSALNVGIYVSLSAAVRSEYAKMFSCFSSCYRAAWRSFIRRLCQTPCGRLAGVSHGMNRPIHHI